VYLLAQRTALILCELPEHIHEIVSCASAGENYNVLSVHVGDLKVSWGVESLSESQDSLLKLEAEFIRINVVDNDSEHAGLLG